MLIKKQAKHKQEKNSLNKKNQYVHESIQVQIHQNLCQYTDARKIED